jgi:DegV family protein with EDD domain
VAADLDITVVPCYVVFGTETYRDDDDLTKQRFYEKLAEARVIPTTAAPAPAVYESAFEQLVQVTGNIVSIHLAGRLSAIHASAASAASSVSGVRIAVLDSELITMGCGWMAIAAAEAARRGESLEQIVALIEGMKSRSRVFAVLDTLEFAHRGGRVGWVRAMIGSLLSIKAIVEIRGGEVRLVDRGRTWKRSVDRLMERVQALGTLERAIILHTNAPELVERVADRLHALDPKWDRLVGQAGVAIASHAGPGAVGIACVTSD